MTQEFQLFGTAHLAVLAATPVTGMLLGRLCRVGPAAATRVRVSLGVILAVNELTWWVWRLRQEGFRFPDGLPLQLCDLILWCTVLACLLRWQWCYEIAFFLGLSATALTLITPDLWWARCWSYPIIYFFLAHAGVVAAAIALTAGGIMRPGPSSIWRALIAVNGWAVLVGGFNLAFHTNYMFLCEKPDSDTILDLLGPWPWYLLVSEGIALALFTLYWLPFRVRKP